MILSLSVFLSISLEKVMLILVLTESPSFSVSSDVFVILKGVASAKSIVFKVNSL